MDDSIGKTLTQNQGVGAAANDDTPSRADDKIVAVRA